MTVNENQRMPGDRQNVLRLQDVSVTFDMERGVSRVLDEVDLAVERGEILGIVGESGSGKSMLASSILNAVVDPGHLTGEVTYHHSERGPVDMLSLDEDELKRVRWAEVSFVVQSAQSGFNPTMDIESHFVETLREHGANIEDGLDRANELLTDLHLDADLVFDSYPHELSGGMQQRALIALSLILEPEVLVMDEPTAALDLLMQHSIISLLDELQQKYELTLIFITHDLSLVSNLADRLLVMYAFEVAEVGPTHEILHDSAHPYTRALLNSVPDLMTPDEEMQPIPGSSPDPVNVPTGCSYHPRCPLADERCRTEDPELDPVDTTHYAACFYPEKASREIPLKLTEDTS